ncbi:hypothetical protein K461DRAFT_316416 [Myriangium duriaei CBS 260.36]|uniref:Uncharacterized protein n=1 Tax=Myriangium duriaei CBS 260.36 TaxID=1168546 RepID=A0A9P4MHK4_9PEZI|nr:hypothetical protein K461DRAFT_316416 [Myriangium duriaei CBS 260.36]
MSYPVLDSTMAQPNLTPSRPMPAMLSILIANETQLDWYTDVVREWYHYHVSMRRNARMIRSSEFEARDAMAIHRCAHMQCQIAARRRELIREKEREGAAQRLSAAGGQAGGYGSGQIIGNEMRRQVTADGFGGRLPALGVNGQMPQNPAVHTYHWMKEQPGSGVPGMGPMHPR